MTFSTDYVFDGSARARYTETDDAAGQRVGVSNSRANCWCRGCARARTSCARAVCTAHAEHDEGLHVRRPHHFASARGERFAS